ncbi:M56 family metallopeptidase [Glaciecola sp. MH2013]|uniref:M56 family metallopeptidase n=1 Tax=Glaciecola sp. MH2013 TaxID=2785524 RepID=UPI00189D2BD6|nr:M56 family metallopeptidase [Glaciecola sp. MH2013]MBF7072103.1 M56 family metallopeptidase [Glaciecola sp. MH2013]
MSEIFINLLLSLVDFLISAFLPITLLLLVLLLSRKFVLHKLGPSVSYQLWLLVPICLILTQLPSLPVALQESFAVIAKIQRFVVSNMAAHNDTRALYILASMLWLAGILALVMLVSATHRKHFARVFSTIAELTPEQKQQIGVELPKQKHPNIYMSSSITSPMITGFFRQKLILPQGFFTQFSATQRSLILAHETHHYGRFDIYWNYLAIFVLAVFWFHPLAWLAYLRFRQDQEISCDQAVLSHKPEKDKQQYARALVHTLEHQQLHLAYLSFGKFGDNNMMVERINQIKKAKASAKFVAPAIILGAALTMAATLQAADVPAPPSVMVIKGADIGAVPVPPKPPLPPKSVKALEAMKPIVRVSPAYPPKAAADNVEGWVVLNFDIAKNGSIDDITIIDSSPKGTFDESARVAVAKWRYPPHDITNANATIQLDFTLDSK